MKKAAHELTRRAMDSAEHNDAQKTAEHMKRRRRGPTTHSIKHKEAGMADPKVHLLVELTIHEGKLDVFKGIAQEMIAGSQVEPGCGAQIFPYGQESQTL